MHFDANDRALVADSSRVSMIRELTPYHWFVLIVAALGWMFDTMDQQLFNLARKPAVTELLRTAAGGEAPSPAAVARYGGYATMIFMIGWATGGLFFGVLGDRIGRAKTMMLTILVYSAFTGLSALSVGVWDFAFYRFLTGLGVGGEFAVGVALVAEVIPDRVRPYALGWVQSMSAIGNMMAAVISMVLGHYEETGAVAGAWRWMFVIGVAPALLALLIRGRLKEPEKWKAAAHLDDPAGGPKAGSISELFSTPRWRRNAIVGMILGFSGVVGLWGIGFFSFDLIRPVFEADMKARGVPPDLIRGRLTFLVGLTSFFQNLGGLFGVYAYTWFTAYVGRKVAFAFAFVLAMTATAGTFWFIDSYDDLFWMIPMMGFAQLTLFGGYAIYFPELFPTRLRSTGTSFCYNVGRLVATVGPLFLGLLTSEVYIGFGEIQARRYAGVTMCAVFLVGLAALPFAPETKGKPLPE